MEHISKQLENKQIKISVIMPAYNCESYIAAAVKSVLNQSFRDFEAIIIDDGSTDGTGKILDELAKSDSRLIIRHVTNGGPSVARNIGLSIAIGEWVYFMDSDDTISICMFEKLYLQSCDADIVLSGVNIEHVKSNRTEILSSNRTVLYSYEDIGNYLVEMSPVEKTVFLDFLWNKLIRHSIISNNSLSFDPNMRLGEDFLFNCSLIKCCTKIVIDSEAYYHYYNRSEDSLVNTFNYKEHERRKIVYLAFENLFDYYEKLYEAQDVLMYNEGSYCLKSLGRINLASCNLSPKEKINYISEFMEGKPRECMLFYLKRERTLKNLIRYIIIKLKLSSIMYRIISR